MRQTGTTTGTPETMRSGRDPPSNKGMKLTKLSAAPTLAPQAAARPEVPPNARAAVAARGHRFAAYPRCSADLGQRGRVPMKNDQPATPETRGVTVTLLATLDLGAELEGMAGRQMRMRMVTIQPGGVFGPVHDHKGRPGMVYVLQGTITDHRDGVAREYGPGVGWPEDRNTTHWLENTGTTPAVEISFDIVTQP